MIELMSNIPKVKAENRENIDRKSKTYLIAVLGTALEKAPDISRKNIVTIEIIAAVSWFSVIAEINNPMAINAAPISKTLITFPTSTAVFVCPGLASNA